MLPFILLIVTFFFLGVGLVLNSGPNWRRRERVIATPTVPIARSGDDEVIEIKGKVVASEHGSFTTPFSGRNAVFCRVMVQELRSRGKSTYWHTVFEELDARDFDIEDASGQQARICTSDANCVLDKRAIATSGMFNDPPTELLAFLASRNLTSETWLGLNKQMQFVEEVIAPGDALYAIGPARREARSDPYHHDAPASRLVLRNAGEGELELLISNKTEDDLVRHLAGQMTLGLVFIGGTIVAAIVLAFAAW